MLPKNLRTAVLHYPILGVFFLLPSLSLWSQTFTLSGTITDSLTGEALINAAIFEPSSGKGTYSNAYGFYSLTLPSGPHSLRCTYVGYAPSEIEIKLTADQALAVALRPAELGTDTVLITSSPTPLRDQAASMSTIYADEVRTLPIFIGEADPMRTALLFPGVHNGNEANAGFHFHGGTVDQNLVLIDEAPVYHAAHLLGIMSIVNPDVFSRGDLYSHYMPGRYGGRLSNVLDLKLREGNRKQWGIQGGIGLISSRLTVEGPIVRDKGAFLLSGRRTYLDLFLPLAPDTSLRNNALNFHDLNVKANYKFSENDQVYLSGYWGRDHFRNGGQSITWGNGTASARWNHIYSPKVFSNFTFIYSRFDYAVSQEDELQAFDWNSRIQDLALKLDYAWNPHPDLEVEWGLQGTYHRLLSGSAQGTGDSSMVNEISTPLKHSLETGAYVNIEQEWSDKWLIHAGFRLSGFQNIGPDTVLGFFPDFIVKDTTVYGPGEWVNTWWNPEPRLMIGFFPHNDHKLFACYQRTVQYLHLATLTPASTPLDIWLPSSQQVQPQTADQVQLRYEWTHPSDKYSAEGKIWAKSMTNTIDFRDHANLLLNPAIEGELRFGKGRAYGGEVYLKKKWSDFQGLISYTWSRSQRQIAEINNGAWYFAPQDKTHVLNLATSYELNPRILLAANWTYMTGSPATLPTGQMIYQGVIVPVYSGRNQARLPDYHRMDVAVTWSSAEDPEKRFEWDLNFSIYNVYNRHNVFAINFVEENGQLNAQKTYLYPVLPAVTWNFKY